MTPMECPFLIIIGERRCGTTSLYRMLNAHPEINLSPRIDFNYFIDDKTTEARAPFDGIRDPRHWEEAHSPDEYWSHFDRKRSAYQGHKGADLFFMHESHARMRQFVPHAKLILLLRNPVKRAFSQYWNEFGKGRESRDFATALAEEGESIAKHDFARDHLSYFHRGLYFRNYQRLLKTFDASQVHVVAMESLYRDTAPQMQSILSFLQLEDHAACHVTPKKQNKNWTLIDKPFVKQGAPAWVYKQYKRVCERAVTFCSQDTEARRKLRGRLYAPFTIHASSVQAPAEVTERLKAQYAEDCRHMGDALNLDLVRLWGLS